MKALEIPLSQAKLWTLSAQGFTQDSPLFGTGKAGAQAVIQHLGYVQIDTISVVERAHHHVLWSRVPDYTPLDLHTLVKEKNAFEYWSHAAAFLPIEEFRFCLPRMKRIEREGHWHVRNRKMMKYVLERIQSEGPLQARDFENTQPKKTGPWFEWKPAKRALEQLFMEGKLLIGERKNGFQKVYDITERVLPAHVDRTEPTPKEFARFLIESTLRSHGFASEAEIRYLRKGGIEKVLKAELKAGVESGTLVPFQVHGSHEDKKSTYFAKKEAFETWSQKINDKKGATAQAVTLLSPFDNIVIQRKRLKTLFDFDYQIECYVPEPKRKFGYFCLPVLWGNQFVGRIDAKANRLEKELFVKKVHFDRGFEKKAALKKALDSELKKFSVFNGCKTVVHAK